MIEFKQEEGNDRAAAYALINWTEELGEWITIQQRIKSEKLFTMCLACWIQELTDRERERERERAKKSKESCCLGPSPPPLVDRWFASCYFSLVWGVFPVLYMLGEKTLQGSERGWCKRRIISIIFHLLNSKLVDMMGYVCMCKHLEEK